MSEPRPEDRPRISLEQLLALKRSERPEPAFWEEFDRELHRRQLASVVVRPAWYVRAARGMVVGLRRAAPVAAAGAAAVAGFLILQRPDAGVKPEGDALAANTIAPASESLDEAANTLAAVAAMTAPAEVEATPVASTSASAEASHTAAPAPAFESPIAIGEPRFVVHELVAATRPARTFVSVTSPNSFSSPAYDASLQMVNSLTTGTTARRGGTSRSADSF